VNLFLNFAELDDGSQKFFLDFGKNIVLFGLAAKGVSILAQTLNASLIPAMEKIAFSLGVGLGPFALALAGIATAGIVTFKVVEEVDRREAAQLGAGTSRSDRAGLSEMDAGRLLQDVQDDFLFYRYDERVQKYKAGYSSLEKEAEELRDEVRKLSAEYGIQQSAVIDLMLANSNLSIVDRGILENYSEKVKAIENMAKTEESYNATTLQSQIDASKQQQQALAEAKTAVQVYREDVEKQLGILADFKERNLIDEEERLKRELAIRQEAVSLFLETGFKRGFPLEEESELIREYGLIIDELEKKLASLKGSGGANLDPWTQALNEFNTALEVTKGLTDAGLQGTSQYLNDMESALSSLVQTGLALDKSDEVLQPFIDKLHMVRDTISNNEFKSAIKDLEDSFKIDTAGMDTGIFGQKTSEYLSRERTFVTDSIKYWGRET
jgi:hypothetical protein